MEYKFAFRVVRPVVASILRPHLCGWKTLMEVLAVCTYQVDSTTSGSRA